MLSLWDRGPCSVSVVALGLVLAGCGGSGPSPPAPTPAPTLGPTPAPTLGPTLAPLPQKSVAISNGLEFECIHTAACDAPDDSTENVLMIHGFPERKEFWAGLMRRFPADFCGVACDMHGYSPNASPDDMSFYMYDNLRKDSYEIARTLSFDNFHLIGHDHGGVLGWHMAGIFNTSDHQKLLSYTSLSTMHGDALAAALYGDNTSVWQQVASQYFTTFVLPNSASLHNNFWFERMKCSWGSCFDSPAALQKAMYWYNGAFDKDTAKLSMPPILTEAEILATDFPSKAGPAAVRALFSNDTETGIGWPQQDPVGDIHTPTLYICGSQDTSLLCTMDWAKKTSEYCKAGYQYLVVDCGHNLASCEENAETMKVQDAILAHLQSTQRGARNSAHFFA